MFYDFKIKFEIAHIKLISKSLDILKSISKGELTRIESLFKENKTLYIENKLDLPEIFDNRMFKLNSFLSDMQVQHYNNKLLNALQLGDFGFLLLDVKQKFIDTGIIMKNKRLNSIEVNLKTEEVLIIKKACDLYWNLLIGNFEIIEDIKFHKTEQLFLEDLQKASFIATNFANENFKISINDKFIHRKAKWAYDISNTIDNLQKQDTIKNIGTLPKLKITKNG